MLGNYQEYELLHGTSVWVRIIYRDTPSLWEISGGEVYVFHVSKAHNSRRIQRKAYRVMDPGPCTNRCFLGSFPGRPGRLPVGDPRTI